MADLFETLFGAGDSSSLSPHQGAGHSDSCAGPQNNDAQMALLQQQNDIMAQQIHELNNLAEQQHTALLGANAENERLTGMLSVDETGRANAIVDEVRNAIDALVQSDVAGDPVITFRAKEPEVLNSFCYHINNIGSLLGHEDEVAEGGERRKH